MSKQCIGLIARHVTVAVYDPVDATFASSSSLPPTPSPPLQFFIMPNARDLRQKNADFANAVRAGKKPTNPSRREQLEKKSPVQLWALGAIMFVVFGGVLFELARYVFL